MKLAEFVPMLQQARAGHYAVPAFGCCNAETVKAVVETGARLDSPVMIIAGSCEIDVLGADLFVDVVKAAAARVHVPVCLHLDHGNSLDLAMTCIEAGFSSVMFDGSAHPFEENIRLTKEVVDAAHARGICVEGELGAVGRVDNLTVEGSRESTLTDPTQAAEFVERTGVDALAASIGNAHGMYAQRPELDFDRLQEIAAASDALLVLHGGSGTEPDQLKRAVELGITKVNVASELARAYLTALRPAVSDTNASIWYACALEDARKAVEPVAERWMRQLDSAGKC